MFIIKISVFIDFVINHIIAQPKTINNAYIWYHVWNIHQILYNIDKMVNEMKTIYLRLSI